jgi:hypothetical protein
MLDRTPPIYFTWLGAKAWHWNAGNAARVDFFVPICRPRWRKLRGVIPWAGRGAPRERCRSCARRVRSR